MWVWIRWLHLLAMAFFVGGQLVVAVGVVPVLRGEAQRDTLRAIARRFGWGTLGAGVVLLATGAAMAGHYGVWSETKLQVKLGLVAVIVVLLAWHARRPTLHAIEGAVFLLSLAVVWLGISLAHGTA